MPGHGAATTDSHVKMPRVFLSLKKLNEIDFFHSNNQKQK